MSSSTPITAVIWDFGGVITSSPFEAFNRLEAERGLPQNFIRSVNAVNPDTNAWAQFERAEIDATTFDTLFAEEAAAMGHLVEGAAVIACLSGDVRPAMVETLDRIMAMGLKIGCITNNAPTGKGAGMSNNEAKAQAVAGVLARFDHVIESSKAGIRKPDPRIYQMMCEALSVTPDQCIYLDDLGINCKPAATLGMRAIKVTGEKQALHDLWAMLEPA